MKDRCEPCGTTEGTNVLVSTEEDKQEKEESSGSRGGGGGALACIRRTRKGEA